MFQEVVDYLRSGKVITGNKGKHLSGREGLKGGLSFAEVVNKGKSVVGVGGQVSSVECYDEDDKKDDLSLHVQKKHAIQRDVFSTAVRLGESTRAFKGERICMPLFRKKLLGLRDELDQLIWSLGLEGTDGSLGPMMCCGVMGGPGGVGTSSGPVWPAEVGPYLVVEDGPLGLGRVNTGLELGLPRDPLLESRSVNVNAGDVVGGADQLEPVEGSLSVLSAAGGDCPVAIPTPELLLSSGLAPAEVGVSSQGVFFMPNFITEGSDGIADSSLVELAENMRAIDLKALHGAVLDRSSPGLQESSGRLFSEPDHADTLIGTS